LLLLLIALHASDYFSGVNQSNSNISHFDQVMVNDQDAIRNALYIYIRIEHPILIAINCVVAAYDDVTLSLDLVVCAHDDVVVLNQLFLDLSQIVSHYTKLGV
jgi:hypothetical protein